MIKHAVVDERPLMPDMTDPRSWRNIAVAAGIPGALSFAVSKALNNRLARKEADEFERKVREFVQAENPVIYLDPDLDDIEAQERAASLGLSRKEPKTSLNSLFAATRRRLEGLLGRKAKPGDVPWATGKLEPGMLAALAWLSALYGWQSGKKSGKGIRAMQAELDEKELTNRLEQSEYDRLYLANDPEGFEEYMRESRRPKAPAIVDAIAKSACSEAPVLRAMALRQGGLVAAFVRRTARTAAEDTTVRPDPGIVERTTTAVGKAVDATKQVAAWTYPSIFAALLLSGYAVGRHVSDGRDPARKRKKALKEVLYREMTENQAPAILAVGSELPWEKAKTMKAPAALDDDSVLPADAAAARMRARREIRL